MATQKITTCLWFDDEAEEAVRFYTRVFKKSKIGRVTRYGEGAPKPAGSVLTIQFWLEDQEFLALNGGPQFKFTEAISLVVNVKDQRELDRMWTQLSKGGEQVQCGWLKDKFGLSWQVVPEGVGKMLADKNPARAQRVMQAILGMQKLDIAQLEKAYRGA